MNIAENVKYIVNMTYEILLNSSNSITRKIIYFAHFKFVIIFKNGIQFLLGIYKFIHGRHFIKIPSSIDETS